MEIYLIIIITIVVLFSLYLLIRFNKTKEHIVNLDETRKKMLTTCCPPGSECYSKPGFLQNNCDQNKEKASEILDTQYQQMFSNSEYNKILSDLKIRQDVDATVENRNESELNEGVRPSIGINQGEPLETEIYDRMIQDNQDVVNGYDYTSTYDNTSANNDTTVIYPNYNTPLIKDMIITSDTNGALVYDNTILSTDESIASKSADTNVIGTSQSSSQVNVMNQTSENIVDQITPYNYDNIRGHDISNRYFPNYNKDLLKSMIIN